MLKKETKNNDSTIKQNNIINEEIILNYNKEKKLNDSLITEFSKKESDLNKLTKELFETKVNQAQIENELNELRNEYKKTKENINNLNKEYLKENEQKNKIENNNNKLKDIITKKENNKIKMNEKNNILKKNNNNLRQNIYTELSNKNNAYKNHILIYTEQNAKLSKELEDILYRDKKIIKKLKRAKDLRNIQDENNNIINLSLNILKEHIIKYGNMGNKFNKNINKNNDIVIDKSNNLEDSFINNNVLQSSNELLNSYNIQNLNNQNKNEKDYFLL